ncbi:hypothetical protein [Pseudonocardia parietis]|uniref:Uncharacterized protein n=1 Tax=Pseudonocardia parietis TaxID=570936 RepID=A0ABS4VUI9_9PSEU|nr:hypothetical protein [Pseudonocardia parietis]MBP2367590.1 hypothetical protein [Pseudonocardia parietis]
MVNVQRVGTNTSTVFAPGAGWADGILAPVGCSWVLSWSAC